MKVKILLLAIIGLGIFLRVHAFSPFKVYPDSYQNLLVAYNISTYHNVVGFLGTDGMLYPDFFMWSRPVYPILINIITPITHNATTSAVIISFMLGILAILLAFFFIKQVFQKNSYGLAAALLISLSFNHTLWGGFIMTETIGVFFMLLFLISLFRSLKYEQSTINDVITGILFALAVLSRYEYTIIFLPLLLLLFLDSQKPFKRLFFILTGFVFTIGFTAIELFPIQSTISTIFIQVQKLLIIAGGFVILFGSILFIMQHMSKTKREKFITVIYKLLLVLFFIAGGILFFFTGIVGTFVRHDFLLVLFAGIGFLSFLSEKKIGLKLFTLTALILLFVIYLQINPDMDRYMTHLLPFLLIPASLSFRSVWRKRILLCSVIIILLLLQIFISYQGLRLEQDSSWYRVSYEEKAAQKVEEFLTKNKQLITTDSLLLVSLPEPYFYTTNISTQSLTNNYPFLYLDDRLNNKTVYLISDMAMYTEFPSFAKFIDSSLQEYKIEEFRIHEIYHNRNKNIQEKHPVTIYKISLKQLKELIAK